MFHYESIRVFQDKSVAFMKWNKKIAEKGFKQKTDLF